jgi:hypothetical protein
MGMEHFGLQEIVRTALSRRCVKAYPKHVFVSFGLGIGLGIALATVIGLGIASYIQIATPITKPTLQLVSDVAQPGGHIDFIQSSVPRRDCISENARLIWWWDNNAKTRRVITLINDGPPVPKLWDGQTVVRLPLPDFLEPGNYFYVRETRSWCSWLNYVFNRPSIERTPDVPFLVVSNKK